MKGGERRKAAARYFRDLLTSMYASDEGRWFRDGLHTEQDGKAIDLGGVLRRIENGYYTYEEDEDEEFDTDRVMEDVRETFENCMRYNEAETEAYKCARKLMERAEGEFKLWTEYVEKNNCGGGRGDDGMKMVFMNTDGLVKKKRQQYGSGGGEGVMKRLEKEHKTLTRQREVLLHAESEMKTRKSRGFTVSERRELYERFKLLHDCEEDAFLMFGVVGILSRGMKCPGLKKQKVVNITLDKMPDAVLREMEYFLDNPTLVRAIDTLDDVEKRILTIEVEYVQLRYKSE